MAKSFGCHCGEGLKPVKDRAWVALSKRIWETPLDSAFVQCLECEKRGLSNAAYVDEVPYVETWKDLVSAKAAHNDKKAGRHGPAPVETPFHPGYKGVLDPDGPRK